MSILRQYFFAPGDIHLCLSALDTAVVFFIFMILVIIIRYMLLFSFLLQFASESVVTTSASQGDLGIRVTGGEVS